METGGITSFPPESSAISAWNARPADPEPGAPAKLRESARLTELQRQDSYIRRYTGARAMATGSPAIYRTTVGPDGKRYVVNGSVDLDVSRMSADPRAIQREAAYVRRIIDAGPILSPSDRSAALEARRIEREAGKEMADAETARRALYTRTGRLDDASARGGGFLLTA